MIEELSLTIIIEVKMLKKKHVNDQYKSFYHFGVF